MGEAYFVLSVGFLAGVGAAWVVAIAFHGAFWIKCTRLERAVGDLQDRVSTFKGRDMAEKRWSKKGVEDIEMAQILKQAPSTSRKYDNDPLGTL